VEAYTPATGHPLGRIENIRRLHYQVYGIQPDLLKPAQIKEHRIACADRGFYGHVVNGPAIAACKLAASPFKRANDLRQLSRARMPLRAKSPYFAVITIQLLVAVPKLDRTSKCVQAERDMQLHVSGWVLRSPAPCAVSCYLPSGPIRMSLPAASEAKWSISSTNDCQLIRYVIAIVFVFDVTLRRSSKSVRCRSG
jgi:hypothetical protein